MVSLSFLGDIYEGGYYGELDFKIAESYYLKAANLGGVFAMQRLGYLSFTKRRFDQWIYWRIKTAISALIIVMKNPDDIRLWHVGMPKS